MGFSCLELTANLWATFSLGNAGWHGSRSVRKACGSGIKMSGKEMSFQHPFSYCIQKGSLEIWVGCGYRGRENSAPGRNSHSKSSPLQDALCKLPPSSPDPLTQGWISKGPVKPFAALLVNPFSLLLPGYHFFFIIKITHSLQNILQI